MGDGRAYPLVIVTDGKKNLEPKPQPPTTIIDVKARRDAVLQCLEELEILKEERRKLPHLTDFDRGVLDGWGAKKVITWAFEILDERFIAPHASTNPKLARSGYSALLCLISHILGISTLGAEIENSVAKYSAHRTRSSNGGKGNSKSRREKQDKDWGTIARPIAKQFLARHPNCRMSHLIAHLRRHADLKESKLPKTDRAIRTAINRWFDKDEIAKPKKIGSEARFTVENIANSGK